MQKKKSVVSPTKKKETEILKPKERTPSFRRLSCQFTWRMNISYIIIEICDEFLHHSEIKHIFLFSSIFAKWESIIWINLSYVWFYWWWTHTYLYIDYFDIHQLTLIEYQIETNDSMNQRNSFSFFWVKRVGNEVRIRILEQKDLHADCMTIAQVTIRYIKS